MEYARNLTSQPLLRLPPGSQLCAVLSYVHGRIECGWLIEAGTLSLAMETLSLMEG